MSLNTQQATALDDFVHFLMGTDTFFSVTGPAGTGKTFLMDTMSQQGLSLYHDACKLAGVKPEYHDIRFCATTNKAAEVLSNSIGKSVQTIHSFLGLKVRNDYRSGKQFIDKGNNWAVMKSQVVFIDECSMIDSRLFDLIMETLPTSKIVFVGDHAQMAPIQEELSPCYSQVKPENSSYLTEPVRNADSPPLMALCSQLRETVETGIFNPIRPVPGSIDFLDDRRMGQELTRVFADMNPSSRVLCYTNAQVQMFNEAIRTDVRNLPPELVVGDVCVVSSAYQRGKLSLYVEQEVEITDISEVKFDESIADLCDGHPMPFVDLELNGAYTVPCSLRPDVLSWVQKNLARSKAWSRFYNLKETYVDLRHKAACTVYKSQGSTYDSVFIDLGNIGTSFDAQQVARMLYVAASRARSRIFCYGTLPSRYHDSQGKPLWTASSGPTASSITSGSVTSAA